MIPFLDLLAAVNLVFLLLVAFCLAVGLLVAPEWHTNAERDDTGHHTDVPPAFREFEGPD